MGDRPSGEAEPTSPSTERRHARRLELPALIGIAILLAIFLKLFVVQAFSIPSASMEPTLLPGDRILVCRVCIRIDDVDRGDVIVFEGRDGTSPDRGLVGGVLHWLGETLGVADPPHEDFVKRVAGLPGDTVEIDRSCCCPDPDECHCPGHDEHDDGAPAMESCHVTVVAIAAAGLPSFEPTVQPAVRAPDIAARVVHVTPASPHAPPVPDRPRGPS